MAAVSVTLTKIVKEPGGRILVRFGEREHEFASLAALQDWVKGQLSRDDLEALFLRIAIDRQASLANPALLEGHTLTVDTSLNNWGTVS